MRITKKKILIISTIVITLFVLQTVLPGLAVDDIGDGLWMD